MDPVVIVGLVDASVGLALKCAGAVQRMNDIASKYRKSKYTLMSITQYLSTMQYAWERIGAWTESYAPDKNADDEEFIVRMARILETGTLVMDALDEDLVPSSEAGVGFMQRAKFIWNENTFLDHQNRIRDQATSMSLLLQAIQLQVPPGVATPFETTLVIAKYS